MRSIAFLAMAKFFSTHIALKSPEVPLPNSFFHSSHQFWLDRCFRTWWIVCNYWWKCATHLCYHTTTWGRMMTYTVRVWLSLAWSRMSWHFASLQNRSCLRYTFYAGGDHKVAWKIGKWTISNSFQKQLWSFTASGGELLRVPSIILELPNRHGENSV